MFPRSHDGWIIDHRFVIGGSGQALVGSGIDVPFASPAGSRAYLTFGYAGIELQYFIRPMDLVHSAALGLDFGRF